jgi:hypothetical protein
MNVPVQTVIEEARGWLGVPYRYQGRDRNGIDCVGLPIKIAISIGMLPASFAVPTYGRLPSGDITSLLERTCSKLETPVAGCIIVIAWSKIAAHTAILTGETMIHAYESAGCVIEHGYRGRWVRMTHSAWAIPGVGYE